jgi:hypothetical protein
MLSLLKDSHCTLGTKIVVFRWRDIMPIATSPASIICTPADKTLQIHFETPDLVNQEEQECTYG